MKRQKKDEERRVLERLVAARPEIFDLEWQDGDEPPDFWALSSKKRIALELTQYLHPCKMNPPRVARERQIERARNLCMEMTVKEGLPVAHVGVNIIPENWPKKYDVSGLASLLVRAVSKAVPEPGEHSEIDGDNLPEEVLRHGVVKVTVFRSATVRLKPFWAFPQLGWLPAIDGKHLQDRVTEKNRILERYSSNYNESWLVVASQTFGLSSFTNLREVMPSVTSDFDKAWFFEFATGRLTALAQVDAL
ncbi:MAG: hypothetical protein IT577_20065 [Verrucomicrobiae bacterium]|nr:hypothetical protein [Verrucomicrobiae bacterium]